MKNIFKKKLNRGFTLIELLVTISIMVIIISVVLLNYHRFNNTFSITNLAYDVAVTIREAQSYGVSVHPTPASANQNNYDFGYGVHFVWPAPGSCLGSTCGLTNFILFADNPGQGTQNYYDGPITDQVVSTSTLPSGYTISQICVEQTISIDSLCSSSNGIILDTQNDTLDIVFLRPNPDAQIWAYKNGATSASQPYNENGMSFQLAQITLQSPDLSVATHTITVAATGQISVQ